MPQRACASTSGQAFIYEAQLNSNKPPLRVCRIDTEGKLLLKIPNATTGEVTCGWGGVTGVNKLSKL